MVDFLLYAANFDASVATRSKMSGAWLEIRTNGGTGRGIPFTNELRIDMARLEIPVSGWTCFNTAKKRVSNRSYAKPGDVLDLRQTKPKEGGRY